MGNNIYPLNTSADGKSRTLIASYGGKQGFDNVLGITGFGCTGVAEQILLGGQTPLNATSDGKSRTLMAGYFKYGMATMITNEGFKGGTTCVAQPIKYLTEDNVKNLMRPFGSKGKIVSKTEKSPTLLTQTGGGNGVYLAEDITDVLRVKEATKLGYTEISRGGCVDLSMSNSKTRRGRNMAEKSNCLQTTCDFYQYCGSLKNPVYQVKDGMIDVKGKKYPIKLLDGCYAIRKLTVRECMRLQTVPEWYDFSCVSNSQAYKMLGNGWTIEVIAHLIKSMLASVEEIPFYEENHQFTLDEFLTMN